MSRAFCLSRVGYSWEPMCREAGKSRNSGKPEATLTFS
jgi:hypothetical protein